MKTGMHTTYELISQSELKHTVMIHGQVNLEDISSVDSEGDLESLDEDWCAHYLWLLKYRTKVNSAWLGEYYDLVWEEI